jgi:hypothetical protein
MTLRQLPGLASLGLLSALLAHTAAYGGGHETGGIYHTALLLALIAGAGAFAVLAASAALAGQRAGDGSIFATLLRRALPGRVALLAASAGWFALIEAVEPAHTEVSVLAVLASLLIAAMLVAALARRLVDAIAAVVIDIARSAHRPRAPFVPFAFAPVPSARAVAFAYRRFARPPPR